jgi:hypothetical protein
MMNVTPAKIRKKTFVAKRKLRAIVRPIMVVSQPKLA